MSNPQENGLFHMRGAAFHPIIRSRRFSFACPVNFFGVPFVLILPP
ncbi:MAG TPA: hypothetical protein VE420_09815 [Gemmatimonadales bacterium]|nr:hypothetical protein [Gemmatimonadales bacterium]